MTQEEAERIAGEMGELGFEPELVMFKYYPEVFEPRVTAVKLEHADLWRLLKIAEAHDKELLIDVADRENEHVQAAIIEGGSA